MTAIGSPQQQTAARLIGVGIGPGDPELLTLRAVRAIREADVVFAPVRRRGERSLALDIVGDHIDERRQQVVVLPFPDERHGETWASVARTVVDALQPGKCGAFLTEGDPLLFGSFGDLVAGMREIDVHVPTEVIPGVTSLTAAAAAAGVVLTDRAERLAVVPATAGLDLVERALLEYDCVILLKVGRVLSPILRLLERLNRLDSSVYVRRCGWPDQAIIHDVRILLDSPPTDYFALLIVHRS